MKLSATDTGGSGLMATHYSVDGGMAPQHTGAGITLSSDGNHLVNYWSVDNNGNTEAANALTVKIDKTAPVVMITSPVDLFGTNTATTDGGNVTFAVNATDGVGSGIAQVKFFVDGVLVKVDTSAGPSYSFVWNAESATLGRHVLSVKVTDGVGFLTEASRNVWRIPRAS